MAAQDTDTTDARLILDALYDGGELQLDWKEVAKAFNIMLPGNVARKFQDILKKYWYKYDRGNNRLVKLDGNTAPLTSTKKEITGDKRIAEKFITKKRKLEDETDESKDGAAGGVEESGLFTKVIQLLQSVHRDLLATVGVVEHLSGDLQLLA